jgi:hypothetical protein
MKAMDVMVRDVVTVKPEADVASAIELLVEHDISALPVIDDDGSVVGVISEADLVRRAEIGTGKQRPWWIEALTPGSRLAAEFAKTHGLRVSEVMSHQVRVGIRGELAWGNCHIAGKAPHQTGSHPPRRQAGRHREPVEPHSSPGVVIACGAGEGGRSRDPCAIAFALGRPGLDQLWCAKRHCERRCRASVGPRRLAAGANRARRSRRRHARRRGSIG